MKLKNILERILGLSQNEIDQIEEPKGSTNTTVKVNAFEEEYVNEAKSAKALKSDYDKAVKKEQALSSLMLLNLAKYKAAKASGNEKLIAKHIKIAGDLSKKKKAASEVANTTYQAYEDKISGLHSDAELEIEI